MAERVLAARPLLPPSVLQSVPALSGLGLLFGLFEPSSVPAREACRAPVGLVQRQESAVAGGVVAPHLTASWSGDDEGFAVGAAEVTEVEQPDGVFGREDDSFVLPPVGVFSLVELVFGVEVRLARGIGAGRLRG